MFRSTAKIALWVYSLVCGHSLLAEDGIPCAALVRVERFGQPLDKILVALIGPKGGVVATALTSNGEARFCDFPFGTHRIDVVNDEPCGSFSILNLEADFGMPQRFLVNLPTCPGGHGERAGCLGFVRVHNEGKPVKGALIHGLEGRDITTDEFGRAVVGSRAGEIAKFEVIVDGFYNEVISLDCEAKPASNPKRIQISLRVAAPSRK